MSDRERLPDELRPVAVAIAYRMLGSVSEAEDVVQEALLRAHQALDGGEQIARVSDEELPVRGTCSCVQTRLSLITPTDPLRAESSTVDANVLRT